MKLMYNTLCLWRVQLFWRDIFFLQYKQSWIIYQIRISQILVTRGHGTVSGVKILFNYNLSVFYKQVIFFFFGFVDFCSKISAHGPFVVNRYIRLDGWLLIYLWCVFYGDWEVQPKITFVTLSPTLNEFTFYETFLQLLVLIYTEVHSILQNQV